MKSTLFHTIPLFITFCLMASLSAAQTHDTISVYFDLDVRDRFDTSPIDSFVLDLQGTGRARVHGYADYLGSDEYNKLLSTDRAQAVARYIGKSGKGKLKVTNITGLGELKTHAAETPDGDPKSRRVDVIIEREQVVAAPVAPADLIEPETAQAFDIDTSGTENLVLEGLSFIPGRHYPLPESGPELERLLLTMKQYPRLRIEIQGHICCEYEEFDGMDLDTEEPFLSRNRAKFVYEYLIEGGIDAARMTYKGYGSSQPKVFPELTEEDQQANRRVEIRIIK